MTRDVSQNARISGFHNLIQKNVFLYRNKQVWSEPNTLSYKLTLEISLYLYKAYYFPMLIEISQKVRTCQIQEEVNKEIN